MRTPPQATMAPTTAPPGRGSHLCRCAEPSRRSRWGRGRVGLRVVASPGQFPPASHPATSQIASFWLASGGRWPSSIAMYSRRVNQAASRPLRCSSPTAHGRACASREHRHPSTLAAPMDTTEGLTPRALMSFTTSATPRRTRSCSTPTPAGAVGGGGGAPALRGIRGHAPTFSVSGIILSTDQVRSPVVQSCASCPVRGELGGVELHSARAFAPRDAHHRCGSRTARRCTRY